MEYFNEEIERLEDTLRENIESPVFARLAALYIEKGEYLHAITLCDHGTETYPEYATGYLLRAIALQNLEKYDESIENLRKVKGIVPRCQVIHDRITELEQKLKEADSGEQGAAGGNPETDSVEELAERLKDYKPSRPDRSQMEKELPEEKKIVEQVGDDLLIVSETLATIFFKQKQFDRAIEAYRRLIERHPQKEDLYIAKIKEVEEAKKNAV